MTASSLTDLTLAGAADALRRRNFSAVELTEAHIRAIELQRGLNAFITETPDLAIAQAKASDERLAKGEGGALEGLPFGIKDLFCTKGIKTTAGSHMLDSFVPPYESTVTAKLWNAGAVCLGKLNLDEFAMGSSNATSYFGPVLNPWTRNDGSNTPLVPGGSSGGSAAAVSARIVLAATGTDTGGSIRQPAGLCGIVGLKPTYGRCSRWGTIAFASSLDQAGPMTRTVEDAALMLGVIAGHDPKDSTSAPVAVADYRAALTGDLRGLKVGVPTDFRVDGLRPEIDTLWQQGLEWLRDAGAEPVEINLPLSKYALAAYYVIAPAEASANLARYDGVRFGLRVPGQTLDQLYENTRAEGFGAEVKRRILIGTYVLSAGYYDAYYLKAQRIRALITREYETAFRAVDVILTPTTPTPAFELGVTSEDPLEMYLNDVFTVPVNLAGLPGLSVPAGFSPSGLPLGLQIIGKAFDEATVLRVGQVIERAASLDLKPGERS